MGIAISKTVEQKPSRVVWSVSPEGLRLYAYLWFWGLVIVGALLTLNYSHVDYEHNPIFDVFGYNNICVFFDTFPANYVLPAIWVVNLVIFLAYIVTSWIRVYHRYVFSLTTRGRFIFYTISTAIEGLGLIVFTTVFSVPPEDSMAVHLLPFTFLILSLSLLSVKNFAYYRAVLDLGRTEIWLGYVYLVVHLSVSIAKMIMQVNLLMGDPLYDTLAFVGFHQFTDRVWMVTAALLPIFFALRYRKRAPKLVFSEQMLSESIPA